MHKLTTYIAENRYKMDIAISLFLIDDLLVHYLNLSPDIDTEALIFFTVIGTAPVFIGALVSVWKKEWASMDMLASIALLFSIVGGEWASAVFISLMLSAARVLEETTERRTKKSINSLLKLRPEKVKVEENGVIQEKSADWVRVGDTVVIDAGEYVPVDGIIISGSASINESSLTGESLPVDKVEKDKVSSGTLVASGSIRIQTTLVGKDTTLEKIIALIEKAQDEKPSTQTLGEKFGKAYLASVFIGSFLLLYLTNNIPLVFSVVLVVCADDIAIAIPLAFLRAIGGAAAHGIIVKGGKHLEALGKAEVVVFDKTGTLTTGELRVTSVYATPSSSEDEIVELSCIASRRSTHPLARAIIAYGKVRGHKEVFPEEAELIQGRGVVATIKGVQVLTGREELMVEKKCTFDPSIKKEAEVFELEGDSVSFVAKGNEVIGFYVAGDTVKQDARKTVKELYDLGIKKVVMLSGDNEKVVSKVAKELGIKDFHGNLLPENKVSILEDLNKTYKVAMVGDGVNDAAALSLASVGIAMGALGSDSAIDSAEIVLMHDNISAIPQIISLARGVNKVSLQDFGIWFATNATGLILVFGGLIGPTGAAAYNFISDFFPLFNSMRVKME